MYRFFEWTLFSNSFEKFRGKLFFCLWAPVRRCCRPHLHALKKQVKEKIDYLLWFQKNLKMFRLKWGKSDISPGRMCEAQHTLVEVAFTFLLFFLLNCKKRMKTYMWAIVLLPHKVFRKWFDAICIKLMHFLWHSQFFVSLLTKKLLVKKPIENLMWLFYRNFHEACKIVLQVIHYHIQLKLDFG